MIPKRVLLKSICAKDKVETANAQFDAKVKELENLYSKAEEEGKEEYLATLEEFTVDFQKQIEEKKNRLRSYKEKFDLRKKI